MVQAMTDQALVLLDKLKMHKVVHSILKYIYIGKIINKRIFARTQFFNNR